MIIMNLPEKLTQQLSWMNSTLIGSFMFEWREESKTVSLRRFRAAENSE